MNVGCRDGEAFCIQDGVVLLGTLYPGAGDISLRRERYRSRMKIRCG